MSYMHLDYVHEDTLQRWCTTFIWRDAHVTLTVYTWRSVLLMVVVYRYRDVLVIVVVYIWKKRCISYNGGLYFKRHQFLLKSEPNNRTLFFIKTTNKIINNINEFTTIYIYIYDNTFYYGHS